MSYRNLKIHTAFNLFTIIVIAMIVINCVVAVFWHEHIVRNHLRALQTHLQLELPTIYTDLISSKDVNNSELEAILGTREYQMTKILFSNVVMIFNHGKSLKIKRLPYTQNSDAIEAHLNDSVNSSPSIFRKHRHSIFYCSFKKNNQTIPVGVEINASFLAGQIWAKEKIILLYILFNATILTTLIFFRFRKTLFIPMDNLLNTATNYQLHDGIWSVSPTSNGEFDQLSQAMDSMVQRIEKDRDTLIEHVQQLEKTNVELQRAQQETIQAEKLAATGRLAAGFAHEIGNPVSIIQGYLELLRHEDYSETEKKDFLNRSISELGRIDNLLFQLMDLAKNKPQVAIEVSPALIYEDVITTLQATLSKANIASVMDGLNRSLCILADPELLRQIFLNILLNAIDAISEIKEPHKGKIICSVTSSIKDRTKFIAITIEDNGCGFDKHINEQIFDPFFTTKPIGKGTGLGLSVVHRLIEDLSGFIEVTSRPQQGTTLTIFIPQLTKDNPDE